MTILNSKKTIIGLSVSLLFVWLAFRKFEYSLFIETISETNLTLLMLAIPLYITAFIFRGFRWQRMFVHLKTISFCDLFAALMIGYAANNLFPARLGEFFRAYVLSKTAKLNVGTSFISILLERVFDGLVIVGFAALFIFNYPSPVWIKRITTYSALLFFGIFFLLFLFKHKKYSNRLLEKMLFLFSENMRIKTARIMGKLIQGIGMLNSYKSIFFVFIISIIIWLFELGTFYLIGMSLNMRVDIMTYILALVIVNLAIMLPSSPAYIGIIQYSCILSLSIFNVERSKALTFSIVLNFLWFIILTVIGTFYVWRIGMNWSQIKSISKS